LEVTGNISEFYKLSANNSESEFDEVGKKKRSRHWGEHRLRVKHAANLEREFGS
jgi:hypothetical protein